MEETKQVKLDENFQSRTIIALGLETVKKISALKVFIYGLRGIGIETAKNIVLNGCQEVSIYDPTIVKINDLGSNFFLSEEDVEKEIKKQEKLLVKSLHYNNNFRY